AERIIDNMNDTVDGFKVITLLSNPAGITGHADQIAIEIYPNPFSQTTTLHSETEWRNATITITNTLGETVNVLENVNGNDVKIERNDLAAGIYFITVTQDETLIAKLKMNLTNE
ncbi:MAG TPA: T9SS type A sorting domain-containing protein, partial [Bacteroidia bacterium]|nr:T9SS type A sorting domain-containing protein [Bacteroidia bacterium]